MKRTVAAASPALVLAILLFVLATLGAVGHPAPAVSGNATTPADPLAVEIGRWFAFVRTHTSKDEDWEQIKQMSEPVLTAAEHALRDGRRLLALQKLGSARSLLAATVYVEEHTGAERKDVAGFEAEWARMGQVLKSDLGTISSGTFDGVRPAAVRAFAEAALPQVRVFYDASLEYGRNTMPESGLFYLGSASAQREFATFCRALSTPSPRRAPRVRALVPELDALEGELLAAFRPPASIDKHGEFITASATLKEARELDAAGLRHGALLKYLQASLRAAPLTAAPQSLEPAALRKRLQDLDARLSAGDLDHSIGRLFLETAQAEVATAPGGAATPGSAAAIASGVLPRYFAALEPAAPQAARPAPRVTVTLVRWPYT